jgi:nucleoside-diphosphate-sugar epimerase
VNGKVVAITGAAGYLGGLLVDYLSVQPWVERIIAVDAKPVYASERVIAYQMELVDKASFRALLGEHAVSHVVHAAFQILPGSNDTLAKVRERNVRSSNTVIIAADNKVEHITFVSSVSVYGYRPGLPQRLLESDQVLPTMDYARQKVEIEEAMQVVQRGTFHSRVDTKAAVVRMAAIAGPRGAQFSNLRALTAQPAFVLSNGGHARTQAIHEQDAVSLIGAVVEQDADGCFNGAPDDWATWADIAELTTRRAVSFPRMFLNQVTRLNSMLPALNGFNRDVVALFSESLVVDNGWARDRLGWAPRYSTCDAFYQMFRALGTART